LAKKTNGIYRLSWNIVDVWEKVDDENIHIDLGSDQTSLHNPWAGDITLQICFEEANEMMANDPDLFKRKVQEITQTYHHN
jgi:urocanate hydratase